MHAHCVPSSRRALLRGLQDLEEQTLRERAQVKTAMASIVAQVAEAKKIVASVLQLTASPDH